MVNRELLILSFSSFFCDHLLEKEKLIPPFFDFWLIGRFFLEFFDFVLDVVDVSWVNKKMCVIKLWGDRLRKTEKIIGGESLQVIWRG